MNIGFFNKSDKIYKQAKRKMAKIYNDINFNIPDYNPFDIPFIQKWIEYPESSVQCGKIIQKGIFLKKNIKIINLKYYNFAQLKLHTHFGFFEMIYIKEGKFKNIQGKFFEKGDVIIIDGFNKHSLKCLSSKGNLIITFSNKKNKLTLKTICNYIK